MAVSPNTVLRLAPDVSVTYRSGIDVEIALGAERIVAGPHGVAILETFRTATPMGEGLKRLGERAAGMQDWIELTAMITTFERLGILQDPAATQPTLSPVGGRFDSAHAHVTMLDDRTRTATYQAAIRAAVQPGDVVVEIGTGSGVLAVTAAQAGAARVYAIEASAIGDSARRVFEANGVADRITLVEGLSSRITLPERCDVLIAEIIGRDPLEEEVLEFTRDAVSRFLKPGGRLVPSHFEIFATPVELPADVRDKWCFTAPPVARWRDWYGIDFSPLIESSKRSPWRMTVAPRRLSTFRRLAEPLSIIDRNLAELGGVAFERTVSAVATADGAIDAVALHFSATLSPGIVLHNDPREARADSSWDHLVWGLPTPVPVRALEEIAITLRHRVDGVPVEARVVTR